MKRIGSEQLFTRTCLLFIPIKYVKEIFKEFQPYWETLLGGF